MYVYVYVYVCMCDAAIVGSRLAAIHRASESLFGPGADDRALTVDVSPWPLFFDILTKD